MNASQRQNILDAIQNFKKADFDTPFKNKYQNTESLESVIVSEYSIAEIFSLAKRSISQMELFLDGDNWRIIPSDNIALPLYGSISVHTVISNITTYLKSANYEQVVKQLKPLVFYEMQCGIWEQPKKIELGVREASLKTLEQRAELTMSHIDTREEKVASLIKELESKKKDIEQLITTKKQELETLKNNQAESNTILSNIKNTLSNASTTEKSIETINTKVNTILSSLEKSQTEVAEQIKTSDDNINESVKSLNAFNDEVSAKLSKITSDYESVSNNAEEVRKMMGYIADGTLSHSFNSRKKELKHQINIWFWAIIIISLIAVVWVCVVFFWLSADTENEWANILINAIKSSPAFLILGFAISQYQKERNLWEEYAFRESVAVTLTAYLEQMPDKEEDDKRKLLVSTVEQLYTKPVIANKEFEMLKLDSKDMSETAKILKELVENFLNHKK